MNDLVPLPLSAIVKAWKNKLRYDFDDTKEYFNLYIDSPFCQKNKCRYCCYNPTVIPGCDSVKFNHYYSEILPQNIRDYTEVFKLRSPSTVYFGGGTSSLASVEKLQAIFEELQNLFDFREYPVEKTFEFNPWHLTPDKINLLTEWNFTHVTIGIQTFNKEVLKHNRRENPPLELLEESAGLLEKTSLMYNMDLMTFIYRDNVHEDLDILAEDLNIMTTRILPRRLTVYPNYFKIDPAKVGPVSEETVDKIIALRRQMAKFIADEEFIEKGTLSKDMNRKSILGNYRYGFNLVRKNADRKCQWKTYSCCGWPNKNKHQNVLGIGGFRRRKPYSYFSDNFCYQTWLTSETKVFHLVYANPNY